MSASVGTTFVVSVGAMGGVEVAAERKAEQKGKRRERTVIIYVIFNLLGSRPHHCPSESARRLP